MIAAVVTILIEAGVPQALAKLLAHGLKYASDEIVRQNTPPSTAGVVREIVEGVSRSTMSNVDKRIVTHNAVAQYLINHGLEPASKLVDTLVQAAVNELLGLGVKNANQDDQDEIGEV